MLPNVLMLLGWSASGAAPIVIGPADVISLAAVLYRTPVGAVVVSRTLSAEVER